MKIEKAEYVVDKIVNIKVIRAIIDGVQSIVPLDSNNRHYAEIMKQVEEGKLTIKDAE
tara:strand:+ start:374 stop:547 length:174 start_codon:yes stop_codon:yes gene_type:complete